MTVKNSKQLKSIALVRYPSTNGYNAGKSLQIYGNVLASG